jgi:hypothetical protein
MLLSAAYDVLKLYATLIIVVCADTSVTPVSRGATLLLLLLLMEHTITVLVGDLLSHWYGCSQEGSEEGHTLPYQQCG